MKKGDKAYMKKGLRIGILRVPMEVFLHTANKSDIEFGIIDCSFHNEEYFFSIGEAYYTFHYATNIGGGSIMFCCDDCYKELEKKPFVRRNNNEK